MSIAAFAAFGAGAVLLGACGADGGTTGPVHAATPSRSGRLPSAFPSVTPHATTTTTTSTTAPSPTVAVVASAWAAAEEAFRTAARTANPDEPALAATTIPPQLKSTQAYLQRLRETGDIARGPTTVGTPHVVNVSATEAIVHACNYEAEVVITAATGKPVPGEPGRPDFVAFTSTMVLTDTGWKLAAQSTKAGPCDPS